MDRNRTAKEGFAMTTTTDCYELEAIIKNIEATLNLMKEIVKRIKNRQD